MSSQTKPSPKLDTTSTITPSTSSSTLTVPGQGSEEYNIEIIPPSPNPDTTSNFPSSGSSN
ncbi:hypothetical protein CC1G_03885 [Coprinopsis cinerea okayama7|uniref:Uncharacterized protein n=1 Tax=Coprinopsis cinerea (strain Okayama-7 / 130 / ATCC MYA-4618 / FGSC 9003) TaxID=240176 RepID=A8NH33_COPC7|nr:hypothetical protein CC1G_03885 [Coprinopsis cinerea okayama7\|eukprot:XP_001833668.1 hypothetical protein CC1G_03885 [Coprinopsis cinerea okayama7\